MRKVVHFEIPADDLDRAKNFYSSVFGWKLDTVPMPGGGEYTSVLTTPVDEQTQLPTEPGAINGGMFERQENLTSPVITIDVDAIDDALAQVEANGGTLVTPRTEIEGMGAFAYFQDPEGNVVGLWETTTQ
jgi:predicted enzyme related to lactoylglutathione lyase